MRKLEMPCRLTVTTKNNQYSIVLEDSQGWASVQGGQYMPGPTRARLDGCTFGGSMIRTGWIAPGMHMEFFVPSLNTTVTTTRIRNAKLTGPDWEFDLQWDQSPQSAGA